MPPAMREGGRLVVVGGVAAGMTAASRARRLRPDIEIVVFERGGDVSYAACVVPYYVAGLVEKRHDVVLYDAEFFRRERQINVRLHTEVTELDSRARTVAFRDAEGSEGQLEFDALVLATGAKAFRPPVPGVDMPGVVTLRTLVDGESIRGLLETGSVRSATIVGGGYVGLEMAEALAARGVSVTIIEMLPVLLSSYDPDMSELVERELLDRGVILRKGTGVDGFEPADGTDRVGYVLAGGQRLTTDLAVVAVGVRPEVGLARDAGLELGKTGAIKVDRRQVTSEPFVLAAGDCCEAPHVVTGRPVWIPLGTTANRQGKIAGGNAVGGNVQFKGVAGTNIVKVFGLGVSQTGLSAEAALREGFDAESVRIEASSRAHAYPGRDPVFVKLVFERRGGRVLGAQIVGRGDAAKRIDTVAAAIFAGMTVADLAAVDTSYAPPFSPVWDPVVVAAIQAVKKTAA